MTPSIDRTLHQFLAITDLDLITEFDFLPIVQGFHGTYATGAACQQRTLTPPDTWSCPTLGLACVLMSRPISPELVLSPDFWISNTPRYFSFAPLIKMFISRHAIYARTCENLLQLFCIWTSYVSLSDYVMLALKFYTFSGAYARRHKHCNPECSKHVSIIFYRENMTSFLIYVTGTLTSLRTLYARRGSCT